MTAEPPRADGFRTRLSARMHGRIASLRPLSEAVGVAHVARYLARAEPLSTRLGSLLVASRRLTTPPARQVLGRLIRPWLDGERAGIWREERIGWERYRDDFDISDPRLTTSLVLKAPGPNGEKGVLYCSFEYNWMRLVAHHDARAVLRDYILVGASSWSPTDYASLANLAGLSDDPVFVGISNVADLESYRIFAPAVRPVPLMACDWIDPAYYRPEPAAERDIDILMIANYSRFKRHWLLFQALRKMRRDLRVTLIGRRGDGRDENTLRAEARAFGVRQELEFVSNVGIDVVTAYQCRARTGAIFSRREGSCVATTECFFADVPVAMMRDAHVGSKAYINGRTGVLLDERDMHRTLSAFIEERERFDARAWAMEHITCHQSSAKLNELLRVHATGTGRPWTRDIAPICWRYVPTYVDPADDERMRPAVEELRERHGVSLVAYPRR